MLLSAVSILVVAQSSSEIPEGLMNNPVHSTSTNFRALVPANVPTADLTYIAVIHEL